MPAAVASNRYGFRFLVASLLERGFSEGGCREASSSFVNYPNLETPILGIRNHMKHKNRNNTGYSLFV